MEERTQEDFLKIAAQRAMLLGLVSALLQNEEEMSVTELRSQILNILSAFIDLGIVLGDEIEVYTMVAAKKAATAELALEEAVSLTKP